jgi:hypothetical protein
MSSPINEPEDLDAVLRYAPPWARRQASPLTRVPVGPQTENPRRLQLSNLRRRPASENAMARLQRQLALNPDAIPEPPIDDSQSPWPLLLRTLGVLVLAALAAWAIVALPSAHKAANETPPPQTAPTAQSANRVKVEHLASALSAPPMVADIKAVANTTPPAPETKTAAIPPPAQADPPPAASPPPPPPDPPPSSSTATLDADEIATLVKRGQDFLQNGDIASARLLLQRAAEAGSASAAFTLGTTFDPLMIKRLGVIGIEADVAHARAWYQKAVGLGSVAASQELARLEQAR